MKNKKKFNKKFIFATVALLMIVGILVVDLANNASLAEAKQTTFQPISKYQAGGLKILEITPTANDRDFGYFFKSPNADKANMDRYIATYTYGNKFSKDLPQGQLYNEALAAAEAKVVAEATRLADEEWQRNHSTESKEGEWYQTYYAQKYGEVYQNHYKDYLAAELSNRGIANFAESSDPYLAAKLRSYGLIKPLGTDAVIGTGDNALSEYLYYDSGHKGIFGSTPGSNDFIAVDIPAGNLVQGHYELNANNNGTYMLRDGYILGTGSEEFTYAVDINNNQIASLDKNYIYKVGSVSMNEIDPTVSENTMIPKYEKINYTGGIPEGVTLLSDKSGNLDFVYLANQADIYYGYTTDTLVYLGGTNRYYRIGAWIKEYILGDATKNYNVTYINKTVEEVTAKDIADADLIYISGTAEEYANHAMSSAVVKELYNKSAIEHKAVMMDYAIYSAEDGLSNLDKLALLLWQDKQKSVSSMEGAKGYFVEYTGTTDSTGTGTTTGEDKKDYVIDNIDGLLGNDTVFTALQSTMKHGYRGNFAVNNVYVYNHHWQDFQNSKLANFQVDALDTFANGDFNSVYNAAAMNGGFQAVLSYILKNNEGLAVGKMTEGYVTPAIAIQYILSYKGESLALSKGAFSVLEIQPTNEYKFNATSDTVDFTLLDANSKANRIAFVKNCLGDIDPEYVSFTSITVDNFNSLQTDLIKDYDIVYIGAEHSRYYEHVKGKATELSSGTYETVETDITSFIDSNMNGCVYYNYGDRISATDDVTERFSSRDLTEAKFNELVEFLDAKGLIIVDEELMKSKTKGDLIINPTRCVLADEAIRDNGRADTSSNVYELLLLAKGQSTATTTSGNEVAEGGINARGNIVSEGDFAPGYVTTEDLATYLSRERISLLFTEKPTDYAYTTTDDGVMVNVSYESIDRTENKYYLDFEFAINSSSGLLDTYEYYSVHLYQDVNADGRFGETEEKLDFKVSLAADGSEANKFTDDDGDGVTQYALNSGVVYKLRREIPADEGGINNWCLKVQKENNPNVYCIETGYTAFKPREHKYINILQIVPNNNSTINLETLAEGEALYEYLHATAVDDQYIISARTITVSQFQSDTVKYYTANVAGKANPEAQWQDYFNNFMRTDKEIYPEVFEGTDEDSVSKDADKPMAVNMVILGFGENYTQFTNSIPMEALEVYVESGRPILVSNDFVSDNIGDTWEVNKDNQNPERTAYATLNAKFLDLFAQDRYGYTNPLYHYNYESDKVDVLMPLYLNGFSTRTPADEKDKVSYSLYVNPREQARAAVAYSPNYLNVKGSTHVIPKGYTNTYHATLRENEGQSFINAASAKALKKGVNPVANASAVVVDNVNNGQIANYPYTIGESIKVSKAKAQKFQLDLDTDADREGNSDVVVWYTLGAIEGAGETYKDLYSVTPKDGINNYYVYNHGSVTYTGFGLNNKDHLTVDESKLFVNTLIAAYEAGLVNPTVSYYETADYNAEMLESIAVPYDRNVTGDNPIDSSIQFDEDGEDYLYKFVNPNTYAATDLTDATKAYFKVNDSNFVKAEKVAEVAFYLKVDGKKGERIGINDSNGVYYYPIEEIVLNDNSVVTVVQIPIDIYSSTFDQKLGTSSRTSDTNPTLEVGKMYGIYVPMSYLKTKGAAEIYIKADTSYKVISSSTGQFVNRPLGTAYDLLTLIKQDLLKLD
ncbi:MAG: DUF5057 domain-containing protein [Lachnospiraceae bacterium]|nr:DUF5057 domain-containing protein [Lachnospiraceae bacterium]